MYLFLFSFFATGFGYAAVEQRGSALFHYILLLITSRAHQTRHNYSHCALIYSNAVSHLQDNYEQFFFARGIFC